MTGPVFSIRPFEEPWRADVIRLWRACGLVIPANDPDADIDRKLALQPELFLIALCDGRPVPVGTVMAGYEGHRGWINYLAVDPEYRHRGLARQLLRAAEEKLQKLGCPKVNLLVRGGNQDAVDFYRRVGYEIEDRVAMARRLVEPPTT